MVQSFRFELNRGDLDATDSIARLEADLDVALVAPGLSPAVLDEEVLHAILDTVAHYKYGVVRLLITKASRIGDDATRVLHKYHTVSLDCCGNRAFHDCTCKLL